MCKGDNIYKFPEGFPMSSPLSNIAYEVFMDHLESDSLGEDHSLVT